MNLPIKMEKKESTVLSKHIVVSYYQSEYKDWQHLNGEPYKNNLKIKNQNREKRGRCHES